MGKGVSRRWPGYAYTIDLLRGDYLFLVSSRFFLLRLSSGGCRRFWKTWTPEGTLPLTPCGAPTSSGEGTGGTAPAASTMRRYSSAGAYVKGYSYPDIYIWRMKQQITEGLARREDILRLVRTSMYIPIFYYYAHNIRKTTTRYSSGGTDVEGSIFRFPFFFLWVLPHQQTDFPVRCITTTFF